MEIIKTEDLRLYYGDFLALKGINISINDKEITALIGPSGCGKSTFLKTLNRMNDLVDSVKITGDVYYNGKNMFFHSITYFLLYLKLDFFLILKGVFQLLYFFFPIYKA